MRITAETINRDVDESVVFNEVLALDGKRILELGCGRAELTRRIACGGPGREVVALEVDDIQLKENIRTNTLKNVTFKHGGAEEIDEADDSVDVVLMFKSLHHVPVALMGDAFAEIHRVLRPGGLAYISEPIFAGDFNDILRLFHDEQTVRKAAFEAMQAAVADGRFALVDEIFFNTPVRFESFSDFEAQVIGVTHTQHHLTPEIYAEVKTRFSRYANGGPATFLTPIRVDLLRKI